MIERLPTLLSVFPLFPDAASTVAERVDAVYWYLVAVGTFFSALIFLLIFYFAIRFRRRSEDERPAPLLGSLGLELFWTVVPLVLALVMFFWGAWVYFDILQPPDEALDIFVVGKQWMWKIQHPNGTREINELHIPVNRPVKLTLTSEDVIHSFYVPHFRVKQDVVPGRYQTLWFEATKPGEYHLFCAEYCGTWHSSMIGRVVVLEPADYQTWLSGGPPPESMAEAGARLFDEMQCDTCHPPGEGRRAPSLVGLYGRRVPLQSGAVVVADETYLRESILNSQAQVVLGYQPIMPVFRGQLSEEQVLQLVAFIESLSEEQPPAP